MSSQKYIVFHSPKNIVQNTQCIIHELEVEHTFFTNFLVKNVKQWARSKYKVWFSGGNDMIVENKTLVQNTRNEKNISQKCIPSESQAKIHGFKIVQNATCLESSAEYKICP